MPTKIMEFTPKSNVFQILKLLFSSMDNRDLAICSIFESTENKNYSVLNSFTYAATPHHHFCPTPTGYTVYVIVFW